MDLIRGNGGFLWGRGKRVWSRRILGGLGLLFGDGRGRVWLYRIDQRLKREEDGEAKMANVSKD